MFVHQKIKVGKKYADVLVMTLSAKNLIVLKGSRGYIMCGYLNLNAARRFKDVAAKITGISGIAEALKANIAACTPEAKKLGIYKGQPVRETLKIIV